MHDELHAPGFIEEAFEHDRVECRQALECGTRGGEIRHDLQGCGFAEANRLGEPGQRGALARAQPLADLAPQPTYCE